MRRLIKNALETILDEFRRLYGVEVDIDVRVHNLVDGSKPSKKMADQIASKLAKEIGGSKPRHVAYGEGNERTTWVEVQKDAVNIAIFYTPSYHTEGENARKSGA